MHSRLHWYKKVVFNAGNHTNNARFFQPDMRINVLVCVLRLWFYMLRTKKKEKKVEQVMWARLFLLAAVDMGHAWSRCRCSMFSFTHWVKSAFILISSILHYKQRLIYGVVLTILYLLLCNIQLQKKIDFRSWKTQKRGVSANVTTVETFHRIYTIS